MDTHCPHCHADLTGPPIPEHCRDQYGGLTHFGRQLAIYLQGEDRVVAYRCRDCGGEWPRADLHKREEC